MRKIYGLLPLLRQRSPFALHLVTRHFGGPIVTPVCVLLLSAFLKRNRLRACRGKDFRCLR
jgi:hypothetical protein